ncbi:MAG: aminopeptidase P family protein [Ruminococcus sp.]|nr:aminopeptidase P family protein [Ruminococcus sp.]
MSVFKNRIDKLKKLLDDKSKALFITDEKNVYYLSGVLNSEGKVLITLDKAYLFVDFRYIELAKNVCKGCEVIEFKKLTEDIAEVCKKHSVNTLFIESENITLKAYHSYLKSFNSKGISLISDDSLSKKISNLRLIKSEEEIALLQEAQDITEKAYNEVLNLIKPGESERTISIELERLLKIYGASDVSFDLITIAGKKTSLPHGVPSDDIIREGDFFTMDIGSLYKGYRSDMTRTVAVGSCDDYKREIYNIVLKAQTTALEAVKSGVKACEIDKISRDIINNAGYSKNFGHATGHGVGLDIHENPTVSPKGDTILSENMVITVEPGIYLENQFGVRIEDMVLVKENGYKNFATLSKELIIV